MQRYCKVCKRRYTDDYRGWYDFYIPHTCSGPCFAELVRTDYDELTDIPGVKFKYPAVDFRSAYEQRFMDEAIILGLKPKYEPYSFTLGNGSRYVPDFLVLNRVFVEVKGIWRSEGKVKLTSFMSETALPILVFDLKMLATLRKRYKS